MRCATRSMLSAARCSLSPSLLGDGLLVGLPLVDAALVRVREEAGERDVRDHGLADRSEAGAGRAPAAVELDEVFGGLETVQLVHRLRGELLDFGVGHGRGIAN